VPFIEKERRKFYDPHIEEMQKYIITKGELHYIYFKLAMHYIKNHGIRYDTLSDVKGVLHDCADMIHSFLMVMYESMKRSENGDVEPSIAEELNTKFIKSVQDEMKAFMGEEAVNPIDPGDVLPPNIEKLFEEDEEEKDDKGKDANIRPVS
jgi:hypothetical protein